MNYIREGVTNLFSPAIINIPFIGTTFLDMLRLERTNDDLGYQAKVTTLSLVSSHNPKGIDILRLIVTKHDLFYYSLKIYYLRTYSMTCMLR